MKTFLLILSIAAILVGILIFTQAQSAIHEIEGLMLVVVFSVCLGSAGVIEAIQQSTTQNIKFMNLMNQPPVEKKV